MTGRRFVQILAGATPGDATTEEAEAIAEAAQHSRAYGAVETFANHIAPALRFPVRELQKFTPRGGDRVLIHYGIRIPEVESIIAGVPYVLLYHNITPPHFFRPYSLHVAAELELARRALPRMLACAHSCLAHSEFSARELRGLGAADARVVSFARHPRSLVVRARQEPRKASVSGAGPRNAGGIADGPLILFVGRLAPNKGHADLIKILFYLRRWLPGARLVLAGRPVLRAPLYAAELTRVARSLGVSGNVTMTGELDDEAVIAAYRSADAFVCASLHEGYCLPILEAMAMGLPVIARADPGSAISDTMGGAGIRLEQVGNEGVAATLARVLSDESLRQKIIARQDLRVDAYLADDPTSHILSALERSVEGTWKAG